MYPMRMVPLEDVPLEDVPNEKAPRCGAFLFRRITFGAARADQPVRLILAPSPDSFSSMFS